MSPTRIQMVRTHWAHWGAHAGIVRYVDYLDRAAFHVHDRPTPYEDERSPGPRRPTWELMRGLVRRTGMPWYTLHDLRAEATAAARVAGGKVDVLHYLDPEHGMQFLPLALRRIPGRWRPRLVATFHQPADLLRQVMRRDVVARLDHATVVSPDQAVYFEGILPADRVSVILHGIDTGFFVPASVPRDSTFTCLTVGHNLRDFALVRHVAELLLDHRDIRFEVVALQAEELMGLPNLTVRSGLSDLQLLRAYQDADVLLLPLKAATANNALLEAFACGLPVVTSDLPAIRAYATDREAILLPRNDPALFVDALLGLKADPTLARTLGAAARQRAEALDWLRIAGSYAQLYTGTTARETNGDGRLDGGPSLTASASVVR